MTALVPLSLLRGCHILLDQYNVLLKKKEWRLSLECCFFEFLVAAVMATTYENMVLKETHKREGMSQKEWGKQHAGDITVYGMDTLEYANLDTLKSKVSDLCDLQPTPASMVRPPRKVRAAHLAFMNRLACAQRCGGMLAARDTQWPRLRRLPA